MRTRFIEIYAADFADKNNYDLVIDINYIFQEEIIEMISVAFSKSRE